MADKDWDDIPYVDGDCIRDEPEWNDMIAYIKHSAACDFTIYDDEASSNQALKVSYAANVTTIEGGALANDDSIYKANSTDTYSKILMEGGGALRYYVATGSYHAFYEGALKFLAFFEDGTNDIIEGNTAGNDLKLTAQEGIHNYFKAGEEFKLFDGATEALKVRYAANMTTIEGGAVTGDDLLLKGSSADANGRFLIAGNGGMIATLGGATSFTIWETGNLRFQINGVNDNCTINAGGLSAHYDLALLGDGVLCLKEGTTPTVDTNYGKIYCKNDNHLYFQDGAGAEHQVV